MMPPRAAGSLGVEAHGLYRDRFSQSPETGPSDCTESRHDTDSVSEVSDGTSLTPNFTQRFQFIDNTVSTRASQSQVRKHVMLDHLRRKRLREGREEKVAPGRAKDTKVKSIEDESKSLNERIRRKVAIPRLPRPVVLQRRGRETSSETEAGEAARSNWHRPSHRPLRKGRKSPAKAASLLSSKRIFHPCSPYLHRKDSLFIDADGLYAVRSSDPAAEPSADIFDPFDSLPSPVGLTRRDHELIRFFVTTSPSSVYGTRPPTAYRFNWVRDICFKGAMTSALTLYTMVISFAANHQAWLRGGKEDSLSVYYQSKAVAMIRERLQRSTKFISDELIGSIISQALQGDHFPSTEGKKYSQMHWQAVTQLVRARGGPSSFASNPKLGALLVWFDMTCGSYQTNEWSFHYSHHPRSKAHLKSLDPHFLIREQCEEFLLFLRNVEHLALATKYIHDRHRSPNRFSTFGQGTTLRNLLSAPLGFRMAFPGERRQLLARLVSLLLIHEALWDFRHSTKLSEQYLERLSARIVETEIDIYPTFEALAQMIIEGIPVAEEGTKLREREDERPWFAGRMLKVAKRLGRPSWQKVSDTLFGFLVLDGEWFVPAPFDWEDELRREIMEAPLEVSLLPAFSGA